MAKQPESMPAIINRKTQDESSEDLLETKSAEGEEAVEELKDAE